MVTRQSPAARRWCSLSQHSGLYLESGFAFQQSSYLSFTVYLDDLLSSLKSLGIGCHWDGLFVGAVSYTDDIALLAPLPSALRLMLEHREEFAISRGLSFNASKTQLICFGTQPSHL